MLQTSTWGQIHGAEPGSRSVCRAPAAGLPIDRYRGTVETISFAFLGPIAGVVCKRAFADCSDLQQVIDELASNLPPNEAGSFRNEIARATGVK